MVNPANQTTEIEAQAANAAGRAVAPHVHSGWIEGRLCVPGDNEETRHRKVQFTVASILVVPAGLLWGVLYFPYGENLLDNAADAMGGKGAITIRTRHKEGWAVVEIEDDGPGIPQEIQPKIFDPFFTTKGPGKGTGLGLSTSYAIVVRKHHGEIRVESRPGLTRLTVKLPVEAPSASPPVSENVRE